MRRPVTNHNQAKRDAWVRRTLSEVPSGSRLLDVAAGFSRYRDACDHLVYESHDSCQLPPDITKYAEHTYVSDVCAIPALDSSYDVILCTEALEHFPDPSAALREMGRLCKPAGLLILTAPLGSGLHQEPYHFYGGFTPHWYHRFLEECGFVVETCQPAGGFFFKFAEDALRAEVYLRKGIDCTRWARLLWPMYGPVLRWLIAPIMRAADRASSETKFTVGYHVTVRKTSAK